CPVHRVRPGGVPRRVPPAPGLHQVLVGDVPAGTGVLAGVNGCPGLLRAVAPGAPTAGPGGPGRLLDLAGHGKSRPADLDQLVDRAWPPRASGIRLVAGRAGRTRRLAPVARRVARPVLPPSGGCPLVVGPGDFGLLRPLDLPGSVSGLRPALSARPLGRPLV